MKELTKELIPAQEREKLQEEALLVGLRRNGYLFSTCERLMRLHTRTNRDTLEYLEILSSARDAAEDIEKILLDAESIQEESSEDRALQQIAELYNNNVGLCMLPEDCMLFQSASEACAWLHDCYLLLHE